MKLFEYQQQTANKAIKYFDTHTNSKFNIFFEMGLGKTITALTILNYLIQNKNCKKILVICPKSLIGMWEYEVSKYLKHYVLINNMDYKLNNFTMIYITNYEQFLSIRSEINVDVCIFDEVHKIKNCNSKIHKLINKYLKSIYTMCLTGTPITNNLMDLFGILTCIGSPIFNDMGPMQYRYKYIINGGQSSKNQLISSISDFTVFAKLTDHIDMPEYEDVIIPVKLTKVQRNNMNNIYSLPIKALDRIIACQRITSGIVPNSVFGNKVLICHELIKSIIEDNNKVIIFTKYDSEFDYFINYYNDICTGINGKTKDRDTVVYNFQNDSNIKIFIGNIQTAGIGTTLTAATHCIFYSHTYNWADYEQARARIYRIGQHKPCIYYHLLVDESIDVMIYKNLKNKTDLISDFKKIYGGI